MIRGSDPLQEQIRSLLGLSSEAPDPEALVWEDSGPRPIRGAEAEEEWRRWHSEDLRADIARLAAALLRPGKAFSRAWEKAGSKHAFYRLGKSSWVRFESTHSLHPSEDWAIEGDLFFEGGSLPFHFIAAEGLAQHVDAESSRYENYLYCEENDLLFENRWIVLPGERVEQEEARRALAEWYRQIFIRRRRHPVAWGKMPQIDVVF